MRQVSSPPAKRSSLLAELARDMRPDRLVPAVTTGLVIGVLTVIVVFSFAALLFPGQLATFLPIGIGLILIGNTTLCFIAVLASSHPSTVFCVQDAPVAILAVLIAGILAKLPATMQLEQQF